MTMRISRRTLLRHLGVGAAMAVGMPSLAERSLVAAAVTPPSGRAGRPGGPIHLDRNENAYGASLRALAILKNGGATRTFPVERLHEEGLRSKIARLHAVSVDQVVMGSGSTEILQRAARAFGGGKPVVLAWPTFDAIVDTARRAGSELIEARLSRDYSHDLNGMLARSNASTGLVYICNPNNPTGSLTRRQDIEAFLGNLPATAHVVLDEAYHHYADGSPNYVSLIDRPLDNRRLIVTRSFSKVYGLARLRIGYAIADAETARQLAAQRTSARLSNAAATAAGAALDDLEHVRTSTKRNADDRQQFLNQANARMLRVIDTHTNFAMVNAQRPATDVVAHLKAHGVIVANPFPLLDRHVRISFGSADAMREFWRVWDLMPGGGHQM
jgi:histidinol-phosphate aminotransferase